MFLLSFLAVILIIGLSMGDSAMDIRYLLDFPSMVILLIVIIPSLIQTGLLKDFNNSFRLIIGKKSNGTFREIKRAITAIQLVRKSAMNTAIFSACISFIVIMRQLSSPAQLGPNLAVAILSISYAAILNIVFLPMEKQLELQLIEYGSEEFGEKTEKQQNDSLEEK